MIPRPRTVVLTFFGAIAWVVVAIWVLTTNSMLGDDGEQAVGPARRAVADHVPDAPNVHGVADHGGSLLGTVWGVSKTMFLLALLGVLALVVVRRLGRRSEARVRLALLPHRDETLDRRAVEDLLSACRELLRETPLRAALLGAPTLGLEVATAPGAGGATVASLALVCPADLVPEVEGALHDRCPDTRLVAEPAEAEAAPPPVVLRLRRPRRGASDGDRLPASLEAMAATGAPVRVHYALAAARRPAGRGRGLADVGWLDARSDAGGAFEPTRPDLVGPAVGLEAPRPLPVAFHVEVRVAGPTRAACAAIAPAAAAGAGLAPAALTAVRGGLLAPLRRRPRATTTSVALAAGWHLPGAEDPGPRVPRTSVPRRPAPPRVSRAPEDALVRDERGPVGLAESDRRAGLGIFGGSAATRAALAGRWRARRAAGDEAVPVVVLAAAPGAAAAARGALDGHRDVTVVAPGRLDVLAEPAAPDALGAAVADALLDAGAGDEARRVLGLTVAVAIAAARSGALDGPPVPDGARRLLRPDDSALREGLARELYRRPGAADLGSFVGHELPAHLDGAAGAAAQAALDGPRARALGLGADAPPPIAFADVLRRRGALVVDLAALDDEDARGRVGRLALAGLGPALRAAAPPGRSASVRAALLIDGADAVVDAASADALVALGDAGLEVAASWRYAGGHDAALRLHRHRCLLGADPAADDLAAAEALCATVLDGDERLTALGALALPEAYMVCSWVPDGGARATFVARAN